MTAMSANRRNNDKRDLTAAEKAQLKIFIVGLCGENGKLTEEIIKKTIVESKRLYPRKHCCPSHVKAIMDNKKKAPFKKAQEVTVYNMIALKMKAVQRHNKDAVLTAAIAQSIIDAVKLKPELEYDKRFCTEVTIAFLWANPPAPCRTEEMQSEFLRKKNEGKAKIQAEKDEEKARQLKIDQLCDEARSLWNRGNRSVKLLFFTPSIVLSLKLSVISTSIPYISILTLLNICFVFNNVNRLLPVTEQSKAFQPDDNSRNAEGEDADDKAGKDGEEDDDSFFEDNTVCVPTNEISVLAENVVNESLILITRLNADESLYNSKTFDAHCAIDDMNERLLRFYYAFEWAKLKSDANRKQKEGSRDEFEKHRRDKNFSDPINNSRYGPKRDRKPKLLNNAADLKGGVDGAQRSFYKHCKTIQRDTERLNGRANEFLKRKREQVEANDDNGNGNADISFEPVLEDKVELKALEEEIMGYYDKMSAALDKRHALVTVNERIKEAETIAICVLPITKRQRLKNVSFRAGREDVFRDKIISNLFVSSCGNAKKQEVDKSHQTPYKDQKQSKYTLSMSDSKQ